MVLIVCCSILIKNWFCNVMCCHYFMNDTQGRRSSDGIVLIRIVGYKVRKQL